MRVSISWVLMSSFCYKVEKLDWSRVLIPWQDNMVCEERTRALGVLCNPLPPSPLHRSFLPGSLSPIRPHLPLAAVFTQAFNTAHWDSFNSLSTIFPDTSLYFLPPTLALPLASFTVDEISSFITRVCLLCLYIPFYQIIKRVAITGEQFTFLPRGSHCVTVSFLQQKLNGFLCIRRDPVGVSRWLGFCTCTAVAGFNSWLGNWDPASCASRQKWNERKKK